MVYLGRVQNGIVVLHDGRVLPDGAEVRVEVVETSTHADAGLVPTLFERLEPVIGSVDGLPPDAALNIHHYLYGHPKQ